MFTGRTMCYFNTKKIAEGREPSGFCVNCRLAPFRSLDTRVIVVTPDPAWLLVQPNDDRAALRLVLSGVQHVFQHRYPRLLFVVIACAVLSVWGPSSIARPDDKVPSPNERPVASEPPVAEWTFDAGSLSGRGEGVEYSPLAIKAQPTTVTDGPQPPEFPNQPAGNGALLLDGQSWIEKAERRMEKLKAEDSDEYDLYGEVVETPAWKPNVPQLGHFGKH